MKDFKYKTDNISFKRMTKLYPYKALIYANVYFHVIDHDYDIDSLDDFMEEYSKQYHPENYDTSDLENMSDDVANNILDDIVNPKCECNYVFDEDDDEDDFDDELYLTKLYSEYVDSVSEYFAESLNCDTIFACKFGVNGETYTDFNELLNETDRSKFRVVVVGVRYNNTIDQGVYTSYQNAINTDSDFASIYDSIRRNNVTILTSAVGEYDEMNKDLINIIVKVLAKYISTYAAYIIPSESDMVSVTLDDTNSDTEVLIQQSLGGFFQVNRFILEFNLNNYKLNSSLLTEIIDDTYMRVIRFGNAVNAITSRSPKMELFKYKNETCLFIKNDVGCTYILINNKYLKKDNKNK